MRASVYLFFRGNCQEALEFYARVTGGRIEAMMPHRGSPAEAHTPPEWHDKILHARLTIGDTFIMASDAPPGRQHDSARGFTVTLHTDTPEEAERVFSALAEGGSPPTMPMGPTFFAARFGMVTDRFGTPWMVICEKAA